MPNLTAKSGFIHFAFDIKARFSTTPRYIATYNSPWYMIPYTLVVLAVE